MTEEGFDPEQRQQHIAESQRNLPGLAYYNALVWIHATLRPANYLEIGVRKGMSLGAALDETTCVGVDPVPEVAREFANTRIFPLTSDDFFAEQDVDALLGGPVELAFIDGLHLFEQVLEDFRNVESHSTQGSLALLHDSIPLDAVTAGRERVSHFYSGDVWKAVLALRRLRPELEMVTVPTAPTGLTIVSGLDRDNRLLGQQMEEIVSSYVDLTFDHYLAHVDEMPPQIPNDEGAVREWVEGRLAPAT